MYKHQMLLWKPHLHKDTGRITPCISKPNFTFSPNAKNAAELLAQPDVDGGLIGGASLKPQDFATIVAAAQ